MFGSRNLHALPHLLARARAAEKAAAAEVERAAASVEGAVAHVLHPSAAAPAAPPSPAPEQPSAAAEPAAIVAAPSQIEGTTTMSSTGIAAAAANPIVAQLEDIGRDVLADVEAKAVPELEPIAQALVDELLAKLPFGGLLEPLANLVLQEVAAKLQAHPAVAGAS